MYILILLQYILLFIVDMLVCTAVHCTFKIIMINLLQYILILIFYIAIIILYSLMCFIEMINVLQYIENMN